MEGCTKRITDDLKDMTVMGFDRRSQNRIMARPHGFPVVGIFLSQFGTALNIGEEEGHRASRMISHGESIQGLMVIFKPETILLAISS